MSRKRAQFPERAKKKIYSFNRKIILFFSVVVLVFVRLAKFLEKRDFYIESIYYIYRAIELFLYQNGLLINKRARVRIESRELWINFLSRYNAISFSLFSRKIAKVALLCMLIFFMERNLLVDPFIFSFLIFLFCMYFIYIVSGQFCVCPKYLFSDNETFHISHFFYVMLYINI